MEFYDVKTRQKVNLDESQIKKVVFNPKGTPRFAVQGEFEGRKLTKFVSKATYDALNVPEVQA